MNSISYEEAISKIQELEQINKTQSDLIKDLVRLPEQERLEFLLSVIQAKDIEISALRIMKEASEMLLYNYEILEDKKKGDFG